MNIVMFKNVAFQEHTKNQTGKSNQFLNKNVWQSD